jgi:hypothetical protein
VAGIDLGGGQRQRAQLLDVGLRQPPTRVLDPDELDVQQGVCG